MQACDVAIVGGGPAGASCAWQLVRRGLDVVILDRARFPRDKVCAGWITPPVIEALEIALPDYAKERVLQPVHGFRVGMAGAPSADVDAGAVISYGIRRCEFDQYLLARSGARTRLGRPLQSLEREGDVWVLDRELRAPVLVGAGGHFCPVARHLGGSGAGPEPIIAARELEIDLGDDPREPWPTVPEHPELFFERDLMGYGWIMRKGTWVNIGLGRQQSHSINDELARFLAELRRLGRIPERPLGRFRGHAYLLSGEGRRRPSSDAALLVGDALGLAYPRSGEGIRPAVESGLLAAEVIAAAGSDYSAERLRAYDEALSARFGRPLQQPLPAPQPESRRPSRAYAWLAGQLLASRWFARHVVIDRWFLHRRQPALRVGSSAAV